MHGQGRLTRGLRAVDLHDAPPWQPTDAQRQVQRESAGRNGLDVHAQVVAHPHDRALTELLLYLAQRRVQRLFPFFGHLLSPLVLCGDLSCVATCTCRASDRNPIRPQASAATLRTGCDIAPVDVAWCVHTSERVFAMRGSLAVEKRSAERPTCTKKDRRLSSKPTRPRRWRIPVRGRYRL